MKHALLTVLIAAAGASCSFPPTYQPGSLAAKAAAEPAPILERGFLTTSDGVRIFVFQEGLGLPAIVVAGGPGIPPAGTWPGLAAFEHRYRFTYYHQRGSGRSDRPVDRLALAAFPVQAALLDGAVGLARQIQDIEELRRALGAEKVLLVGHSFGGFLAALYAAEFPDRVGKLLLLAPADVLRLPSKDGGLYERVKVLLRGTGMERAYQAWMRRQFNYGSLFRMSEAELAALNGEFYVFWNAAQEKLRPAWGAEAPLMDASGPGGWIQQACFLSMGSAHDYTAALRGIVASTLIIQGDADAAGTSCGRVYAQAIPGARLVAAQGAGHFIQADPVRFPALVKEFLEE
jgi:proline iminopeptidase